MDDSEMAEHALEYALEAHPDADITVLHTVGEPSAMMGKAVKLALEDDFERAVEESASQVHERAHEIAHVVRLYRCIHILQREDGKNHRVSRDNAGTTRSASDISARKRGSVISPTINPFSVSHSDNATPIPLPACFSLMNSY